MSVEEKGKSAVDLVPDVMPRPDTLHPSPMISYVAEVTRAPANAQTEPSLSEVEATILLDQERAKGRDFVHEIGNAINPIENVIATLKRDLMGLVGLLDKTHLQTLQSRVALIETAYRHARNVIFLEKRDDDGGERKESIRLAHVNISDLLRAKITYWSSILEGGLTINASDIEDNVFAETDEVRLTQVLGNAFLNALESMRKVPDHKHVLVVTLRKNGKSPQIIIQDNGCGIPKELEDKVFESGVSTKSGAGRGRGLTISRQIMLKMRGSMALVNNADRSELHREDGQEVPGASVILEFPPNEY